MTVNLDPADVHAPAVLIKRFLREMPEPLLTFEFYDAAMDICSELSIFYLHIFLIRGPTAYK